MNEPLNTLLNLFFRWAHIVAGITWIGLLYFFNWVNGPFQGKIDGPTKKVVNPELLPRALFWFRWAAVATWVLGAFILGERFLDAFLFRERAYVPIGIGAWLGTIMIFNVWVLIWPNQKKIITALKAGSPLPPDSPEVKIAGLRSRHNTYMSVPLVMFMISNHYPTMFSNPMRDACAAGVIVLGFFMVWLLYWKAGKVQGF